MLESLIKHLLVNLFGISIDAKEDFELLVSVLVLYLWVLLERFVLQFLLFRYWFLLHSDVLLGDESMS